MLLADLATQVKRRFGDQIGSVITDTDIIAWVNEGCLEIAKQTKVNFLETSTTVTAYLAASSLIPISNGITVEYVKFDDVFLDIKDYRLFEGNLAVVGRPQWYYQQGFSSNSYALKLYPAPDASMGTSVIKLGQQSSPTVVTALIDTIPIPVTFHPDLMNFCLVRAHERNKDWQGMDKATQAFNAGLTNRVTQAETVEDSNPVVTDVFESYGPVGFY